MKVQDYLTRKAAAPARDEFLRQLPAYVLVEIEGTQGQDAAAPEVAVTTRLTSANIRHQSLASREARVIELPRAPLEVVVGRSSKSGVVVDHASVSKEHACFHVAKDGLSLEDLGSTNGTFVQGARLEPHKPQPVVTDTAVRFGRASVFHLLDAAGFFEYLDLLQRFGL